MPENVPSSQLSQPPSELAPVAVNLPPTQLSQVVTEPTVCLNVPGPQELQVDEPALLKPPSGQAVHVSVAPVL